MLKFNSFWFLSAILIATTYSASPDIQARCFTKSTPKPCIGAGFLCETCSRQVRCEDTGRKSADQRPIYRKVPINQCALSQSCVQDQIGCVDKATNPDPYCDGIADLEFQCRDTGVFPDLFYCDRYHFCSRTALGTYKGTRVVCKVGETFDVLKKDCVEGTCPGRRQLAECTKPGDRGPIQIDDNTTQYYYICTSLKSGLLNRITYPVVYKCPDGQTYEDSSCKESNSGV